MNCSHEELAVLEVIREHTAENKILDAYIRSQVRVQDPDKKKVGAGLRRIINSLRTKGYPICSDTGGYWYAQSKAELIENVEALRGRALKILEAVSGMQRAIERYDENMNEISTSTLL